MLFGYRNIISNSEYINDRYLYGTGYDESHYMKNLTKIYNNMLYGLLVNPKRKY